jgi:hypothetical protein
MRSEEGRVAGAGSGGPEGYFLGFALLAESEGFGGGVGLACCLAFALTPFLSIGALMPS